LSAAEAVNFPLRDVCTDRRPPLRGQSATAARLNHLVKTITRNGADRWAGCGGGRLFNWLDDRMSDGPNGQVFRELMATGAAQALLRAGLLDEMEIHLVPVLLGGGRRLFDSLGPDHIELELVRRLEGRDATHLRYGISV
jgi:hypothetical protein